MSINYRLITAFYSAQVKLYKNNAPRAEAEAVRAHEVKPRELDSSQLQHKVHYFSAQFLERQVKSSY